MRLTKISAVCGLFALGMTVALSAVKTHATPISSTVLGNLGSVTTDAPDFQNTAVVGSNTPGNAGLRFAMPIRTSSNWWNREVKDVYLGLTDLPLAASTAVLRIVTNSGSNTPTSTTVATASLLLDQGNGLYKFSPLSSGSSVKLAASTDYWVTLEAQNATSPESFAWARSGDSANDVPPTSPIQQNGSGWSYPTFVSGTVNYSAMSSNNNGAWTRNSGANGLSISITAVPEPSTYALAAAGLGMAGFVGARRRKAGRAPAKG